MIATTIEQSKHLLELGLDPKTADMCFEMDKGNWTLNVGKKSAQVNRGLAIPAWTFDRLLDVMPKSIIINKREYKKVLWQNPTWGDWTICYEAKYYDGKTRITARYDHLHTVNNEDKITAAYEMVCWLTENGYIKTKEK